MTLALLSSGQRAMSGILFVNELPRPNASAASDRGSHVSPILNHFSACDFLVGFRNRVAVRIEPLILEDDSLLVLHGQI